MTISKPLFLSLCLLVFVFGGAGLMILGQYLSDLWQRLWGRITRS